MNKNSKNGTKSKSGNIKTVDGIKLTAETNLIAYNPEKSISNISQSYIKSISTFSKSNNSIPIISKSNTSILRESRNDDMSMLTSNVPLRGYEPEPTSATRLLAMQQEIRRTDSVLEEKKEEFDQKMNDLEDRKQKLDERRLKMKQDNIKFNKYLQDLDVKRSHALTKVDESLSIKTKKYQDIIRIKDELKLIKSHKNRLASRCKNYVVCEDFLQRVANLQPEDFNELDDVIARAMTLKSTHDYLIEYQKDTQEKLNQIKQEIVKYNQEKSDECTYLHLELEKLRHELDKEKDNKMIARKKLEECSLNLDKKLIVLGNVIRTAENLYDLVEKNKEHSREDIELSKLHGLPQLSTSEQLMKMIDEIKDMGDIIRAKKHDKCRHQLQ